MALKIMTTLAKCYISKTACRTKMVDPYFNGNTHFSIRVSYDIIPFRSPFTVIIFEPFLGYFNLLTSEGTF